MVISVRKDLVAIWLLHHDTAPSRTSLRGREFLPKAVCAFPSLSLSLPPSLLTSLKRHCFDRIQAIQAVVTIALKALMTTEGRNGHRRVWGKT